eukprot:scaffold12185_cov114-Skeletonema_dohrnii-CCMP3373.AAC.11
MMIKLLKVAVKWMMQSQMGVIREAGLRDELIWQHGSGLIKYLLARVKKGLFACATKVHWSTLEYIGVHTSNLLCTPKLRSALLNLGVHYPIVECTPKFWSALHFLGVHWSALGTWPTCTPSVQPNVGLLQYHRTP